jgi:D-glycero-D-manno-heptose 1,7-bisphosphate phosphatase
MKPAVFIDRDGTIIDEMGYVVPGSDVRVYPFSAAAIARLSEAGFPVVVITNQGGIALGMYDHAFVEQTHQRLADTLARSGAPITAWYFCPHHPEGTVAEFTCACECRKPNTGLLDAAARDLDLDLSRSWVIGDQWRDIELARRAGARGILVRTGYGGGLEHNWPKDVERPPVVCDDLMAAARHILAVTGRDAQVEDHGPHGKEGGSSVPPPAR